MSIDCNFEIVPGTKYPDHEFHGTLDEQKLLVKCILENFGKCECHPVPDWMGHVIELHMCPAHQFLNEKDMPGRTLEWTAPHGLHHVAGSLSNCVSRCDRLMFVRKTLRTYMHGEFYIEGEPRPTCNPNVLPGWIWAFQPERHPAAAEDFSW